MHILIVTETAKDDDTEKGIGLNQEHKSLKRVADNSSKENGCLIVLVN